MSKRLVKQGLALVRMERGGPPTSGESDRDNRAVVDEKESELQMGGKSEATVRAKMRGKKKPKARLWDMLATRDETVDSKTERGQGSYVLSTVANVLVYLLCSHSN